MQKHRLERTSNKFSIPKPLTLKFFPLKCKNLSINQLHLPLKSLLMKFSKVEGKNSIKALALALLTFFI